MSVIYRDPVTGVNINVPDEFADIYEDKGYKKVAGKNPSADGKKAAAAKAAAEKKAAAAEKKAAAADGGEGGEAT
jgi:hypothetical protein